MVAGPFFVYILRCADGSLYVGRTAHLSLRLQQHNAVKRIVHVRSQAAQAVIFRIACYTGGALKRERQLKLWTRDKKEALIRGDMHQLKGISARRRST